MSDNQTDPVIEHLRERRAELNREIDDRAAAMAELDRLITTLSDGRHRLAKRRKSNSAPPTTQPEVYDDSVSLDEVHG